MSKKNGHRSTPSRSRPPRRKYTAGELFMAGLGLLLLILMVGILASALVGGS